MRFGPAHNICWQKGKLASSKLANNSFPIGLLPPCFCLPIVHQQVAIAQSPRGAEIKWAAIHRGVEYNGCIAQWAEGDNHWTIGDHIVDNFVPHQNLERVNARLILLLKDDYRFLCTKPFICLVNRHKLRVINGMYAIFRRATGKDFTVRNAVNRKIGAEFSLRTGRNTFVEVLERHQGNG